LNLDIDRDTTGDMSMLDVKAGIMWIAIFIALAIVAVLVGGAYSTVIVLLVFSVIMFIGFACILTLLGEIRDALVDANGIRHPDNPEEL
jgi:hypothetical protein